MSQIGLLGAFGDEGCRGSAHVGVGLARWMTSAWSGHQKEASGEEIEAGPAKHLALEQALVIHHSGIPAPRLSSYGLGTRPHQNGPRALTRSNPYRRFADTPGPLRASVIPPAREGARSLVMAVFI
jgi:hypothetical protein